MDMFASHRTDETTPLPGTTGGGRRSEPRHATVLLIGRIRGGMGEAACLVHDISRGGMLLRFASIPQVGERLLVEVRGLAEAAATVRWIDGSRGGVAFEREQEIDGVFRSHDAEGHVARSPRFAIHAPAVLRVGEVRLAVDLLDISPGGVKIETPAPLRRGEAGSITLPRSGEPVFGTICWTRDTRAGFRFARPLTLAMLSQVLAGV